MEISDFRMGPEPAQSLLPSHNLDSSLLAYGDTPHSDPCNTMKQFIFDSSPLTRNTRMHQCSSKSSSTSCFHVCQTTAFCRSELPAKLPPENNTTDNDQPGMPGLRRSPALRPCSEGPRICLETGTWKSNLEHGRRDVRLRAAPGCDLTYLTLWATYTGSNRRQCK